MVMSEVLPQAQRALWILSSLWSISKLGKKQSCPELQLFQSPFPSGNHPVLESEPRSVYGTWLHSSPSDHNANVSIFENHIHNYFLYKLKYTHCTEFKNLIIQLIPWYLVPFLRDNHWHHVKNLFSAYTKM